MLARVTARFRDLTPLPLRLVMGLAFMVHGYPKITNLALTAQNFGQRGFVPHADLSDEPRTTGVEDAP